jgi:hypothetical protein
MHIVGNTSAFALPHSELNGFLFADIGVEESGMPLSVLSTLARLGMDPWQEAARLARLPRSAAIEALARVIATMPRSLWPLPDATAIAARLVALLPTGGGGTPSAQVVSDKPASPIAQLAGLLGQLGAKQRMAPVNWRSALLMVVLAGVLAAVTMNLTTSRDAGSDAPAPLAPSAVEPAAPSNAQVPTNG